MSHRTPTRSRFHVSLPPTRPGLRTGSWVSALVLLAACSTAPRKPTPIPIGDYAYVTEYTDYAARRVMSKHDLPGLAIALIDGDEVVLQQAWGASDLESDTPATTDTVFKMWSLSKLFTALEVMRLVDEGLVELDEPVEAYLPEFAPHGHPDSEPITVRHLLTHGSGLPRNQAVHIGDDVAGYDVLEAIATSTADCFQAYPAGQRYKYSNLGFDLLGHLVQRVRGRGYIGRLQRALLQPLGMSRSGFHSSLVPAGAPVATGYALDGDEHHPRRQYDVAKFASGNLHATIEDMATFVRFVLRGGGVGDAQLIARDTLASMFESQPVGSLQTQPMGLGWKLGELGDEALAWHDGGPSEGIGALVALLPETGVGLVLVANCTTFDGRATVPLAVDLLRLMVETKTGEVPPRRETRPRAALGRAILEEYEGRYVVFGEVMDVERSGDELQASISGMTLDLIPVGETRFRVSHWLARLGLLELFGPPLDLDELRIEFVRSSPRAPTGIVVIASRVAREYGDRYPLHDELPAEWSELIGSYDRYDRLASGRAGSKPTGRAEITARDGVLWMSGSVGPILPRGDTRITIVGGPFAGETMEVERPGGRIVHQAQIYVRRGP